MIKCPKIPEGMSLEEWLRRGVAIGLTEVRIEAQPKYRTPTQKGSP